MIRRPDAGPLFLSKFQPMITQSCLARGNRDWQFVGPVAPAAGTSLLELKAGSVKTLSSIAMRCIGYLVCNHSFLGGKLENRKYAMQ